MRDRRFPDVPPNPVRFSPISFCEPVCGEGGVFLSGTDFVGDYDWYELNVTTASELVWEVEGEFPVGAWIVDGRSDCEGASVMAADWRCECEQFSLTASVDPGIYWLVVGPALASDLAQCGARYTAIARRIFNCPGDLDGDGDIDLSDLGQLLANYGMTSGAEHEDGDLDCDRDVDLADLAGLLSDCGGCQTSLVAQPEGDGLAGAISGAHASDEIEPHPQSDAEGIWFNDDCLGQPSSPSRFGNSDASIVP